MFFSFLKNFGDFLGIFFPRVNLTNFLFFSKMKIFNITKFKEKNPSEVPSLQTEPM
jgi:hypothetical protein